MSFHVAECRPQDILLRETAAMPFRVTRQEQRILLLLAVLLVLGTLGLWLR